jgi:hypothetical protein
MKGKSTFRLWRPRRAVLYGWGFFMPPIPPATVGHLGYDRSISGDFNRAVMAAAHQDVLRV